VLRRLRIENLVLIREAELELAPGLNAITGETGAGKTILAQAFGLLLGAKGGEGFVGAAGDEAYVEAELELPAELGELGELRPEDEDALVVSRRVFTEGRTRAYAWGRAAAREDVAAAVESVVAMSGQFEQRHNFEQRKHRKVPHGRLLSRNQHPRRSQWPGHQSASGPVMTPDDQTTAPSAAAAAAEVLVQMADVARTALQTQVSQYRQSVDFTRATVFGDLDRTSAAKAYVEAASRESTRYWQSVGRLATGYSRDLIALANRSSTAVLRDATEAGRQGKRPAQAATGGTVQATPSPASSKSAAGGDAGDDSPRRVRVALSGSLGGRAEGTIMVANQHPRPRRIQLSAGEVVDSRGVVVAATLDVSPTNVTVPSEQERAISLGVDLDDKSFSSGRRYSSTVDVRGGDEATIEVTIDVGA